MVTETKEKKSLNLGNWQVFVLGKLNHLYQKGELCDVTLKFDGDGSIVAHKLILTSCTNFFDNLQSSSAGDVLHMPKTMKISHIKPIINFMYTGRLEYMSEDHNHVVVAAKHLGMTVITHLLNMQQQVVTNKKSEIKEPFIKKNIQKLIPTEKPPPQDTDSDSSLPPPPPPPPAESCTNQVLPGKKLPFWKKRTVHLPEDFYHTVSPYRKPPAPQVDEIPQPTRFNWPEEEVLPDVNLTQSFTMNSFENLSYDSKVMVKPAMDPKPVITEDSIEVMPEIIPTAIHHGSKRPRVSEVVKGNGDDDDDDYDDGHFETLHDTEDEFEEEEVIPSKILKTSVTPPKPILKTHEMSNPTPPSKRVRFSFPSENETTNNSDSQTPPVPVTEPLTSTPAKSQVITSSVLTTPVTSNMSPLIPGSTDYAKIVRHVLNSFPNMPKGKNLRVKIQGTKSPSATPPNTAVGDKEIKGQQKVVQYVVLKSEYAASVKKEMKSEAGMGVENRTGPWHCSQCTNNEGPQQFETYYNYRRHLQEVHNQRIDARICEHCGYKASKRNLHLYHLYTKHNIPPPRNINFPKCDMCNYIALSESLLIKHRTNHTGSLIKEYICRICNAAFKSNGALSGHMQTNLHNNDQAAKKDYECEYCGKIFNRNINLKAHIRTSHQEESRKIYDDEDKIDDPPQLESAPEQTNQNLMEVIEVPGSMFNAVPGENKTLYLPQGMTILAESPALPLLPSSESEAMINVATDITNSINLTNRPNDLIVINDNAEIILQTPATYLVNQGGTFSVQEYIVPEIITESGRQVFTTALVSTAPTTGISYVNNDNIIMTASTDHTYADGTKLNGNVNTGAQVNLVHSNGPTIITSQVQVSQANQPIIVQEPIIVGTNWVQSIATSQPQSLNLSQQGQKVEIISTPLTQVCDRTSEPSEVDPVNSVKTAQTLVNDWGDLEEDNLEETEVETDMKPSRPTIELSISADMDM